MSVINKAEVEIEIVNRYLNKEINLLEKEMALNILLACNNPNKLIEEDVNSLADITIDMSAKEFTDLIITFGRENFNSNKLDQKEIENLTYIALEQRKNYEL